MRPTFAGHHRPGSLCGSESSQIGRTVARSHQSTQLRAAPFFAFNLRQRDEWIADQAAAIPAGARVLDVGAGACRYRPLFAHCDYKTHDFKQLTATDVGWGGYGAIDYVSDICAIPVADASFDAILCAEVLEHVPNPISALGEMARILNRGGTLLLTAPQRSGAHQAPHHYYGGFTPSWYKTFLPEHGLTLVSITPNGGLFRAYGEETQRVALLLASATRFPPLPLGRLLRAVLKASASAVALASEWLDRYDKEKTFTVGYHVVATRM